MSTSINTNKELSTAPAVWKDWERTLFRVAFIFFVAMSIPNNLAWYSQVIHIDWFNLHYRDLYDIARFGSGIGFFGNTIFGSSLSGYATWIITLLFAIAGGAVWTAIVKLRKAEPLEYNNLYYWLRVIVRYRAGIGIIGFGFTKLLPVQMPYPSLGILNTDFGDLTSQKIFWLSVGIVPWYQIFAGVVESAAGAMLFFRKTTFIGAALLFGALGDIVYVNFAYDGGVHVYSSYFVLLSGFLMVYYIPHLYKLFILEQRTTPVYHYPALSKPWQKYTRVTLKAATIFIFLIVLFYLQLINFWYDPYKQPSSKGVTQLRGNYNVKEFRYKNQVIPYSPLDSVRWQEVTFENWSTLSFKVNKKTPLDLSNGGGDPQRDLNRTFEIAGVAGGRRVFHYLADTIDNVLYLQDKYKANPAPRNIAAGAGGDGGASNARVVSNSERRGSQQGQSNSSAVESRGNRIDNSEKKEKTTPYPDAWISKEALAHIGDERLFIDKRAASTRRDREFEKATNTEDRNRMILTFETKDGSEVVLKGTDQNLDSIYVVLEKVDRNYALSQSDLVAGKY